MFTQSKARQSEFRTNINPLSSIDGGSSNEYSGERESEFMFGRSSQAKGSEFNIGEDHEVDLDSLPIDFSKLLVTKDANGQVSMADKEQFR